MLQRDFSPRIGPSIRLDWYSFLFALLGYETSRIAPPKWRVGAQNPWRTHDRSQARSTETAKGLDR
ncbi:hypothetical protein SBBP2_60029 [Burkholderiales bacterium]|nr:hypothetical protein SBBP2_60029 [Burkholderiales bacterium]